MNLIIKIKLVLIFVFFSIICFAQQQDTVTHIVITGQHKVEHLEASNDHTWFNKNYKEYKYDSTSVNKLKNLPKEYHLVVIAGTWCPDTHTELPKFYKIIDDANFSRERIKLYFVDRNLKDAEMVCKKYKVSKIPTFILFKEDKEKSRITEKPKDSIEKDLVKSLK
ncbi:MAG: thioredoxin [Cytophagales bacterium]|nr:MAG: thioredoxin [Cytophagales bacterium]